MIWYQYGIFGISVTDTVTDTQLLYILYCFKLIAVLKSYPQVWYTVQYCTLLCSKLDIIIKTTFDVVQYCIDSLRSVSVYDTCAVLYCTCCLRLAVLYICPIYIRSTVYMGQYGVVIIQYWILDSILYCNIVLYDTAPMGGIHSLPHFIKWIL